MICPKCNKENDDGLDFCTGCGNRLTDEKETPKKVKLSKKKIIIICMIAIVAVCAVLYFTGNFPSARRSAEDVAITGVEAYLDFDHDTTLSLFPEEYKSWVADKYYKGDRDSFEQMIENKAEENKLKFESRYGSSWSYSDITVSNVREYSRSEIDAFNEDYDGMGLDISIKEAQKIKLKYTLTYITDDDARIEENKEYTAFVINIDGKWYLFDE